MSENFLKSNFLYESSNHLGNVLATVSDRRKSVENTFLGGEGTVNYYLADVTSRSEYYPYGMVLPGRSESDGGNYRYGFQGQEDDPEIKGAGNSTNYKYRMHDPRIGRFFATDPLEKEYPYYTPYSFSGNEVISAVELEGLEPYTVTNPETGERTASPAINIDHNSDQASTLAEGDLIEDEYGNKCNYHCGAVDPNGNIVGSGGYHSENYIPFALQTNDTRYHTEIGIFIPMFKGINNTGAQLVIPYWGYGGLDPNSGVSPFLTSLAGKTRWEGSHNQAMGDATGEILMTIPTFRLAGTLARGSLVYLGKKLISNTVKESAKRSVDDFIRLFTPQSEFDVSKTLYRGTTGSEATSSAIFLTDDATVAATYVKNGGQVMEYQITHYSTFELEMAGELTKKTGIHGTTGIVNTEYMFEGRELVKALNSIAKPYVP